MISADEAVEIILEHTEELQTEVVNLPESLGRVLAADIRATEDIPPFDNSSMDGFALRSIDTRSATASSPIKLSIVGVGPAGEAACLEVLPGTTVRIMTGAQLPVNADAVLQQELAEEGEGSILVSAPVGVGTNVRAKGEDIVSGEGVLARGTRLRAGQLGVLASIGSSRVVVFKKPKVGILTTGNELVGVEDRLSSGKIRNSNAHTLMALVQESGGLGVDLGVAKDDEADLVRRIQIGLDNDLLITSGGVSVGKYDYVLDAIRTAGVDLKFRKVNIKPGMPLAFGIFKSGGKSIPVFCLPGNPVSTMVTFIEFIRPCLKKMTAMERGSESYRFRAALEHSIQKNDGKRHFHRGIVVLKNGKPTVRSTGNQSSGILTSMVKANCLITLPEEQTLLQPGEEVEVELLT